MALAISAVLGIVLHAQLIAAMPRVPLPKPSAAAARAMVHQNRVSAGRMVGNTLRVDLEIVESAWAPEGKEAPELPILAFAERGKAPLVPGPLVRVPQGTVAILTLRDRSDSALVIGVHRDGAGSNRRFRVLADAARRVAARGEIGGCRLVYPAHRARRSEATKVANVSVVY